MAGLKTLTTGNGSAYGFEVEMDPSPVIIVAAFEKLGLDIRSFRVPLERSIKEVMSPSLMMNFRVGGRPQWVSLSPQTVEQKAALGFAGATERPLVRTGKLSRTAGQLNLWHIDGQEGTAAIESLPESIWYGAIHQQGASTGGVGAVTRTKSRLTGKVTEREQGVRGYVPQREWAVIQDEDIDKIEEIFGRWMDERIAGLVLLK